MRAHDHANMPDWLKPSHVEKVFNLSIDAAHR
jgi:hypothetical protein